MQQQTAGLSMGKQIKPCGKTDPANLAAFVTWNPQEC